MKLHYEKGNAKEFLMERVDIDPSGCWLWNRSLDRGGYGGFGVKRGDRIISIRAHRAFYEEFVGDIPAGLFVCHTCDVPRCCNPQHLFLGTNSENMVDAYQKGRISIPRKRSMTDEQYIQVLQSYYNDFKMPILISEETGIDVKKIYNIVHYPHATSRPHLCNEQPVSFVKRSVNYFIPLCVKHRFEFPSERHYPISDLGERDDLPGCLFIVDSLL